MNAHTPGTWYVWGANNIQTLDGGQLAIVQGRQTAGAGPAVWAKQDAEERRDAANARLIAAAPSLLEAAQGMYEMHKDDVSHQLQSTPGVRLARVYQREAALTAIRDAIAAATGEEEG